MKKYIFIIAILLASFAPAYCEDLDSTTVTLTVKLEYACVVAGIINDNAVVLEIAKQGLVVEDDSMVTITLTERQVANIWGTLSNERIGPFKELIESLEELIIPILFEPARVELRAKVSEIKSLSAVLYNEAKTKGCGSIQLYQSIIK